MKVLILFAHPALERSRINVQMLIAAREVSGVEVHDLYEAYPSMHIDVKREQALLEAHDAVVFQHPFYWYSTPAILKQWQDLVLEHGWAYGRAGDALEGKLTFNVISTGGPRTSYHAEGYNRFPIRTLLSPYEATANLCGMKFLAPFALHGVLQMEPEKDLLQALESYRRLLGALVSDRVDLKKAAAAENLADAVDEIIQ